MKDRSKLLGKPSPMRLQSTTWPRSLFLGSRMEGNMMGVASEIIEVAAKRANSSQCWETRCLNRFSPGQNSAWVPNWQVPIPILTQSSQLPKEVNKLQCTICMSGQSTKELLDKSVQHLLRVFFLRSSLYQSWGDLGSNLLLAMAPEICRHLGTCQEKLAHPHVWSPASEKHPSAGFGPMVSLARFLRRRGGKTQDKTRTSVHGDHTEFSRDPPMFPQATRLTRLYNLFAIHRCNAHRDITIAQWAWQQWRGEHFHDPNDPN